MSIDFNILAKCDNTLVFIAGDAMGVICYLSIAINAIKRFLYSDCTFIDFNGSHYALALYATTSANRGSAIIICASFAARIICRSVDSPKRKSSNQHSIKCCTLLADFMSSFNALAISSV